MHDRSPRKLVLTTKVSYDSVGDGTAYHRSNDAARSDWTRRRGMEEEPGKLRFSLRPSRARRRDAPLVPCLSLKIATPNHPWDSIEVVRLLDPEHRYV